MNKIIIATLFALLAVSAYGTGRTARTAAVACTTTATTAGCSACGASPFPCTALDGYYVLTGTPTTPVVCADNCAKCQATGTTVATAPTVCTVCYGTDETLYNTTVKGTTASGNGSCNVCVTGAIKDSSAATAACINASTTDCYTAFAKNGINTATGIACISTTVNATNTCLTGYSDVNAAAPTSPTLAGDCKYCALGYTDVAAGTAATNPPTTACKYCLAATYSWTSGSSAAVCGLHATACVTGWTDMADGTAASATRTATTKGCIYCLTGKITDGPTMPYACIDPATACSTGNVKNGGNATQTGYACVAKTGAVCLTGWTADATTGACTVAATSGSILMVSVAALLSIIMIIF